MGAPSGVSVSQTRGIGPRRVIFVCAHDSARSIMAESLLRKRYGAAYEVNSAGTEPGRITEFTLQVLEEAGLPTARLRSRSVAEFLGQPFDHVIPVCDPARQDCPIFPGEGQRMHWGYDDPSAADGSNEARLRALRRVLTTLSQRIDLFLTVERSPTQPTLPGVTDGGGGEGSQREPQVARQPSSRRATLVPCPANASARRTPRSGCTCSAMPMPAMPLSGRETTPAVP